MGKDPILPRQTIDEEEEEYGSNIEEDEEFYEKIEAPKFVDLTLPDPYRPDDRYWFCSRVGCDQKHEEEMDAEAIYKNFVLRVMAARSPNIKLRKALIAKHSSTNAKCPLSAPAKSSRPRVSRLAMISSVPQKMVLDDPEGKVRQLPKLASTPMPKSKQVAAKYMTTPRNKNCLRNPNSFRSVQNLKLNTVSLPKNRMVAKALVFHSPKKAICVKTSVELRTPLTKICEGMKRLQITSQRKGVGCSSKASKDVRCNVKKTLPLDPSIEVHTPLTNRRKGVLGRSRKSSKDIKCSPKKALPVDPSRKQLSDWRGKSAGKDSVHSQISKQLEAKSLKRMKSNSKGKLAQQCHSSNEPKEVIKKDSSDVEIDLKSRGGSEIEKLRVKEGNEHEDLLEGRKTSETSSRENLEALSDDASRENEESAKDCPCRLEGPHDTSQVMDGDDKENAQVPDDNRGMNDQHERKILRRQETNENNKKGACILGKNFKEGAPEVKHRKPKPTNPKPFRLRTDERGILKEANLERKFHILAPQREATAVSRFHGGNPLRRHGTDIKQNEKCSEQSESNNAVLQGSEKEAQIILQKKQRTVALKTLRGQMIQKTATITPQRSFRSYSKDNANQLSDNRSRETNSPSLQRRLVKPQGVDPSRKAQLSVIKETSSKILRPKEGIKPRESNAPKAAVASAKSRSSSRGRRPVTVPTEPKFHSTHVPKSCTRNIMAGDLSS
ncbi:hypothetical protein LguiA_027284 [Lonicera macranthoides]